MVKRFDWRLMVLLIALAIVVAILAIHPGKTTFAGSHTIYKNKTGATELCNKCHPDIVANLSTSIAHNISVTGCICHGYNPNSSGGIYDVNLKHNLTKNIYCTNCHTNYTQTGANAGKILVRNVSGQETWTENQSAHYIFFNRSDETLIDELYNRSKTYFEQY